MLLSEIVEKLGLTPKTEVDANAEAADGYCSDLLSDVLNNAKSKYIWVTNQKHQNCVAVASLLELSALIIAGGTEPDDNTIEKAISENVPLYTTKMSAFEVSGRLYELGIRGENG